MNDDFSKQTMGRGLRCYMLVADLGLLTYWGIVILAALGLISIPASVMYSDAENQIVVAWNWSFFPLDVVLSIVGIVSVSFARRNDPRWLPLAIVSLALTFCAGFMALSFWMIRGNFDPSWWGVNLFLTIGPLFWIRSLFISTSAGRSTKQWQSP